MDQFWFKKKAEIFFFFFDKLKKKGENCEEHVIDNYHLSDIY